MEPEMHLDNGFASFFPPYCNIVLHSLKMITLYLLMVHVLL